MKFRSILWSVLATSLLIIVGLSVAKLAKRHHSPLQDFGTLSDFSLVDQANRPATLETFRGKIWIADLIFTHCENVCPMLTSKMLAIQTAMKDEPNVMLASVTVD